MAAPAQPRQVPALGRYSASDPALIAKTIEEIEKKSEIDLAVARLVPPRHVGDLHMRIAAEEVADMLREIAFHDLAMIEIELQRDIG